MKEAEIISELKPVSDIIAKNCHEAINAFDAIFTTKQFDNNEDRIRFVIDSLLTISSMYIGNAVYISARAINVDTKTHIDDLTRMSQDSARYLHHKIADWFDPTIRN